MRIVAFALAALLVAPAAAGGFQPVLYFMKDGELGPVGTGVLNATLPDGLDPSIRPVLIGTEDLPSATFAADQGQASQIWGPVIAAVWFGPSVVIEGNITAVLYEVDSAGARTAILSTGQIMDFNESNLPEPTSLIPPEPTDVNATIAFVLGHVLNITLQPPAILNFGLLLEPYNLTEGSNIEVGFYLEGRDLPVPIGLAATLQYDGLLMPSLVYIPWFEPDEPTPTPAQTPTPAASPTPTGASPTPPGSSRTPTPTPENKDSPFLGFALLAVALAAVGLARRD